MHQPGMAVVLYKIPQWQLIEMKLFMCCQYS